MESVPFSRRRSTPLVTAGPGPASASPFVLHVDGIRAARPPGWL